MAWASTETVLLRAPSIWERNSWVRLKLSLPIMSWDCRSQRQRRLTGSARSVHSLATWTNRRRPTALSQLLALGSPLDEALSDQRENRAEWSGWNLPAGACSGGRYSRGQLAAWKLHPAIQGAARCVAQRRDRSDACPGNAVRAGGG